MKDVGYRMSNDGCLVRDVIERTLETGVEAEILNELANKCQGFSNRDVGSRPTQMIALYRNTFVDTLSRRKGQAYYSTLLLGTFVHSPDNHYKEGRAIQNSRIAKGWRMPYPSSTRIGSCQNRTSANAQVCQSLATHLGFSLSVISLNAVTSSCVTPRSAAARSFFLFS